jgi:hypothetical protein
LGLGLRLGLGLGLLRETREDERDPRLFELDTQ